jgi:hypothetical protein
MVDVRDTKIETVVVELSKADVRQAMIDAARNEITSGPVKREVDGRFVPQIVEDGYGGATVYFRAAESLTKAA